MAAFVAHKMLSSQGYDPIIFMNETPDETRDTVTEIKT